MLHTEKLEPVVEDFGNTNKSPVGVAVKHKDFSGYGWALHIEHGLALTEGIARSCNYCGLDDILRMLPADIIQRAHLHVNETEVSGPPIPMNAGNQSEQKRYGSGIRINNSLGLPRAYGQRRFGFHSILNAMIGVDVWNTRQTTKRYRTHQIATQQTAARNSEDITDNYRGHSSGDIQVQKLANLDSVFLGL
eukprot:g35286.t1